MPESDHVQRPSGSYNENTAQTEKRDHQPPDRSREKHNSTAPELRVELVAVDGEEGEKLHAIQSAAARDALLWLATEQRREATFTEENDT